MDVFQRQLGPVVPVAVVEVLADQRVRLYREVLVNLPAANILKLVHQGAAPVVPVAVVEVLADQCVRLYREVLVNLTSQHSRQHTQTGSAGGSTGRVGLYCEVRVDLNHRQTHTSRHRRCFVEN